MIQDNELISIPQQGTIALRIEWNGCWWYLSVTAQGTEPQVGITLRAHCDAWEHFILHKHRDGCFSLQNGSGCYLSPQHQESTAWRFRQDCPEGGWERLRFEPLSGQEHQSLTSIVSIAAVIDGRTMYLAPPMTEGDPCRIQQEAVAWTISLVGLPILNYEVPHQELILQMWRAHQEIGAFQLVGHGLSSELFQCVIETLGEQEYQEDNQAENDAQYKQSFLLMGEKDGESLRPTLSLPSTVVKIHWRELIQLTAVILDVFAEIEEQSEGVCSWRDIYNDQNRYIALRALAYHPGPLKTNEVVTTSPHTDATWLTLLQQDEVGGLQMYSKAGERWVDVPPVENALVINTGNVLTEHSQQFFPSVCHRVVRRSSVVTRCAMVFFYDRKGSTTQGC